MADPLATAIVSTYASERFLRGCLQDLLAQTLGERLEIVVIDACSPEGEGTIVREFQLRHHNIRYVRTRERELSSASFNRATAMARGTFLSTCNTDDRHHPAFFERMCGVLQQHPEYGIAYADSRITHGENETWTQNTATKKYGWPDYTATTALSCCLFGAQPVWRRSVHETVGLWDPDLHFANDQDLFLRSAARHGAVHVREDLGLFLMRQDSVSGADNRAQTIDDVMTVMRRHRRGIPLEVLFPALREAEGDGLARVAALFELGNLCALGPYTDAQMALDCYREALAVPVRPEAVAQVRSAFANNTGCVLACAGAHDEAVRALRLAGDSAAAQGNLGRLAAARVAGRLPQLRQLDFAEIGHPVVTHSRTTCAVVMGQDGRWSMTKPHEQVPWDVFDGPNGVPIESPERTWSFPLPAVTAPPERGGHVMVVMYGWADSGGGTMLPRQFSKQLAATGRRVSVFYAAARREPGVGEYGVVRVEEDGVQLFSLCNRGSLFMDLGDPRREVDDPLARAAFASLLDELRPDVVHFWNLHNLGMSLPGECRARGIPTVLSSNNYWAICPRLYLVSERLQRCEGSSVDGTKCETCLGTPGSAAAHAARKRFGIRMLREDIDVHLAVSNRVRDLYVQNGDDPAHVRVLRQEPAGVTELWNKVGAKRRIVERLDRPLRVGFLGSVMAHKGVHVLAEALQLLPDGAVECVVLGDLTPDYVQHLQRIDTKRRLHFFGRYDQSLLPDLLAKFDVMVVPSVWDDCAPFVVAESLAARCPVIGSRIGGIPDFVQHGSNGLLFEAGNTRELANCLDAFRTDPHLLGRLQRAIAPPRGLAAFTADATAVYDELARAVVA